MSKTEPQNPVLEIYCDIRESRTGILEKLVLLGAKPIVGELEIGDFVLTSDLVVERKSAVEFVASILDGRLFNQAGKTQLNFSRSVFLIEGDVYSTRTAIAREAIDGALSFLVAINGCSVLYVKDQAASANLIFRMAKQAQDGSGNNPPFRRGKTAPGKSEALFMIEGTPGVGPATSIKILNHFRSARAFFTSTLEDLQGIAGLGPKRAARIHQAINWELPSGEEVRPGHSLFSDG